MNGRRLPRTHSLPAIKTYGDRIEMTAIGRLKPYPKNARTHSQKQVRQIADSIKRFSFTNPVLVDDAGMILAGHGRVEAARLLVLISAQK